MKREYKRIIIYVMSAIAVPFIVYIYYINILNRETEDEKRARIALTFQLGLDWYNSYSDFQLCFSRYVISKWVNDKKVPSAKDTYQYIKTLKFSNNKYDYARGIKGNLNLYDSIKIYNNMKSLLVVSPPKKFKQICSLHKIKDEAIYVIAFLPLKELLKSSKLFVSPKNSFIYSCTYGEIKDYYPETYNCYLKWIPESQATKLIHLYKSNYAAFVKRWKVTKTLLDYELLYSYKAKNIVNGIAPGKSACAINITALNFVLEYFRKNHAKIEAFIKELEDKDSKKKKKD